MASRRPYPVIAAAAIVVVLLVLGAVWLFARPSMGGTEGTATNVAAASAAPTPPASSASVLDAGSPTARPTTIPTPGGAVGTVAISIQLPIGPSYVSYGAGTFWAYFMQTKEIVRVDPRSSRIVADIPIDYGPLAVLPTREAAWVTTDGGPLLKIDPSTNKVVATIPGVSGQSMTMADGSLWLDEGISGVITRVDPETYRVLATIPMHDPAAKPLGGGEWSDILLVGNALWATDTSQHSILRIDTQTNKVAETIPVGVSVDGLTTTGGDFWLWSMDDKKVLRFSPVTRKVTASFDAGANNVLATPQGIWVSLPDSGELMRIDPASNRMLGTLNLSGTPGGTLDYEGALWVANSGLSSLVKVIPAP